jgi:hypothetical protein
MHTLAAKLKESQFDTMGPSVVRVLEQLCRHLPCPECAEHAHRFWSQVTKERILTKTDLITLLFVFHNSVNARKRLPLFSFAELSKYESIRLMDAYSAFVPNFNTRGNLRLMTESLHRGAFLQQLQRWMMQHLSSFDP